MSRGDSETDAPATRDEADFSALTILLLKGVVRREAEPRLWRALLDLQSRLRAYVGVLNLHLVIEEVHGYAHLRERAAGEPTPRSLPRWTEPVPLSLAVCMLLALLRRRLAEHDTLDGESRLVLSRAEIETMLAHSLPAAKGEQQRDGLQQHIDAAVELGFLRPLRAGATARYEVERVLAAFVDANWLAQLDRELSRRCSRVHDDAPSGRMSR